LEPWDEAEAGASFVIVGWLGWAELVVRSEVGGADVSAGGDRGPMRDPPELAVRCEPKMER
jgi:hypothetical protein